MKLSFLIILLFAVIQAYPQTYVKVWSDEFNSPGLPDSTKWNFNHQQGYNNEVQHYTQRQSRNAWIEDTTLIIELRKEPYLAANYTSAMLQSKFKGDWLYGKFEIRAKVPTGSGSWPAIWMMPTDDEYGYWPSSGEIDIMEYIGKEPNNVYFTTHYLGMTGTHSQSGNFTVISQPFNKFIKFTLVWTPTKMEWYADNKLCFTYNKISDDPKVWPYNKMFYMILNLAYGGWGGVLDDTKLPKRFYVDYVRVYQLQETAGPFSLSIAPPTGGTVELSPQMDTYPEGTMVTVKAIPNEKYEFDKWLHVGSANPITIEVTKDMTLIPIFKKKNELILNGDFGLGTKNWDNWFFNTTQLKATGSVVDGTYIIDVTQPGTAGWHICNQQGGIAIEKDVTYIVSFDAKADNPNTMDVYISKNHDDYSGYYSTTKSITSVTQHFSWTFKMLQNTDTNCRFGFGFGKFTGKLYMDNVSIEKQVITGTNQVPNAGDSFVLFPNPASDFVDFTNLSDKILQPTIKLYNIHGQLVSTLWEKSPISAYQNIRLSLNGCSAGNGIYFVQITIPGKSITRKLIIDRQL